MIWWGLYTKIQFTKRQSLYFNTTACQIEEIYTRTPANNSYFWMYIPLYWSLEAKYISGANLTRGLLARESCRWFLESRWVITVWICVCWIVLWNAINIHHFNSKISQGASRLLLINSIVLCLHYNKIRNSTLTQWHRKSLYSQYRDKQCKTNQFISTKSLGMSLFKFVLWTFEVGGAN